MSFEELKTEAFKLSQEEREILAGELWESLNEREITSEEGSEWNRRLEELESGKVTGFTHEETMRSLRQALEKSRESRNASVS